MATGATHSAVRGPRVLVASSRESFRRRWIEHPEYDAAQIEEAAGGADALAKLESENWGEVLLDRRLHDLNVDEVVQIIRMRCPDLPVRIVDSELNSLEAIDSPESQCQPFSSLRVTEPDDFEYESVHTCVAPAGCGESPAGLSPSHR